MRILYGQNFFYLQYIIFMIKADKYYIENLKRILDEKNMDENPRPKYKDGTPAYTYFTTQVFEEYDLNKGEFPITTLRNTATKIGIQEILWIYQDQNSSLDSARSRGINWWEEWNIGGDTIGMRYGATVGKWNLINNLLNGLINDPFGRRHIINLWQESDLKETKGLNPCAYETLWSVRKVKGEFYLDMTLTQRSNDYLMAGYINKIQYVALQMMIASHCGYKVGKFCHLVQNLHVYDRHLDAANEILNRNPLSIQPQLILNSTKDFYDFTINDFTIINIDGIEKIKSPLEISI